MHLLGQLQLFDRKADELFGRERLHRLLRQVAHLSSDFELVSMHVEAEFDVAELGGRFRRGAGH